MNGFSLLVVLASLGADADWVRTIDGRTRYAISIDRNDLDALRGRGQEKQAHATELPEGSRNLRYFQIAVPGTTPPARATGRNDDGIVYGWEPSRLGQGGLDFLVQVSPERFESLASGRPVWGNIPAGVEDIRQMIVFIGNSTKLTQKLPAGARNVAAPPAPDLLAGGVDLTSGSEPTRPNAVSAPTNVTPEFNGSRQPPLEPPLVNGREPITPTSTGGEWRGGGSRGTRVADTRGSDYGPPQPDYRAQDPRAGGGSQYQDSNYDRVARGSADPRYRNDTYQEPGYRSAAPRYNEPGYSDPGYREPRRSADPRFAAYDPPTAAAPGYGQQPPLQRPQQPVYTSLQPQQPPLGYAQPQQPAVQPAVTQPVVAATTTTTPTTTVAAPTSPSATVAAAPEDEVKPWGPLILTTMALFTSLGANAYLGWLAWSFFWRFKDVASDVARARNQAA